MVILSREDQIKEYFKVNNLKKPVTIRMVGPWAYGEVYAVTCGIIRLRKYAVYFMDGKIHSVRTRG